MATDMEITEKLLPDFCYKQKDMDSIDGLVIHYFSGRYAFPDEKFDLDKCYDLFVDLNLPGNKRGKILNYEENNKRQYASAHYMIGRAGEIVHLVPEPKIAWHAGKSEMNGRSSCNNFTVGIEMIATYNSGYTDEQYNALSYLSALLIQEYGIPKENIQGHEHIDPGRKKDPGPEFDWDRYIQTIEGVFPHKF